MTSFREDIFKPPPPDVEPDLSITGILDDAHHFLMVGVVITFAVALMVSVLMMCAYHYFCLREKELDMEMLSEHNRRRHSHPHVLAQHASKKDTHAPHNDNDDDDDDGDDDHAIRHENPLHGTEACASAEGERPSSIMWPRCSSTFFTGAPLRHAPHADELERAWQITFRHILGDQERPDRSMRAIHAILNVCIDAPLDDVSKNVELARDVKRSSVASMMRSAMEQCVPTLFAPSASAPDGITIIASSPREMESFHTVDLDLDSTLVCCDVVRSMKHVMADLADEDEVRMQSYSLMENNSSTNIIAAEAQRFGVVRE